MKKKLKILSICMLLTILCLSNFSVYANIADEMSSTEMIEDTDSSEARAISYSPITKEENYFTVNKQSRSGNIVRKAESFSPIRPRPMWIIGEDDRDPLLSLSNFPYSTVCFIITTFPNGDQTAGTGTMIGDDTVLTAAHALYDDDKGTARWEKWAMSVDVYPAAAGGRYDPTKPNNGLGLLPFGSATGIEFIAGERYIDDEDHTDDWGVIKLTTGIGDELTGYCGFSTQGLLSIYSNELMSRGYPYANPAVDIVEMYEARGSALYVGNDFIRTDMDIVSGQSGSGVTFSADPDDIFGVVSGEVDDGTYSQNFLVRFTQDVFDLIYAYSRE